MIPAALTSDRSRRAGRRRRRRLGVTAALLLGGLVAAPPAGAASSWFVTNSPAGAEPTIAFGFGDLGDVFLAGDWNGDGIDTPGVYRQRAGVAPLWVLSNSPNGGGALISFAWGNPTGDIPIVGDWNGDGSDTVGLFRPLGGGPNTFFLANGNADGGGGAAGFTLGNPGDAPIAGDWNADGVDTVGLVRPTAGAPEWIQAASNATSTGFTAFGFGNPGDLPLAGDWNGDGTDTVGIFRRQGAGTGWALAGSNAPGGGSVQSFQFGNLDDTPVVGDWDASGTDTAGVVRPGLTYVPPPVVPRANGQNASRLASLTVAYATKRARVLRVGFKASPLVTGRLVNERGTGIGGATIVVLARRRQSRAVTGPIGTVTTAADGSLRYAMPSGPSRTLTFAYTAFAGDPRPADSDSLRTLVRASVTARITPRSPRPRQLARVSGRLRYLPRAGVQVIIQFRRGRVWRTVGNVKTRAGGRYTWRYRFLRQTRGRTFTLRARVDSPIYPFVPSNSKAFRVRVR